MLIVDSQVHVWGPNTPERPWVPELASRAHTPEPLSAEILRQRMDEAGVDRAVLVPPSWEGDRNDVSLDAARRHPDRFGVMGRLSLTDPASRGRLPGWRREPGMLGLRFTFHTANQRPWLTDGTADWLWPAAEAAGVPLMVHAPGSLDRIAGIAERHPALRLIIDHMGVERGHAGDPFAHLPDLLALARHPNIGVKVSALPSYTTEPYPFRGLHRHVRGVYDSFGAARMFWGTDLSRLPCPYRQAVTMFTEEMPWLSEQDLAAIMGGALCDWLGWPADTGRAAA